MYRTGALMTTRAGRKDKRKFLRIPVVIPVRVEAFPASQAEAFAVVPGALLNIGRGGGLVRARWEFPLRARLVISLPVAMPSLQISAEVVWRSCPSGRELEPATYGVRWGEPLASNVLEEVLLGQGLTNKAEVVDASWRRN